MPTKPPNPVAPEWLQAGFTTTDAHIFSNAAVPIAVARQWTDAGIEPHDAVEYIEKTVPLEVAIDLREREIELGHITRTDHGYEVDLEPWQENPVDQLPKMIVPGRMSLSIWTMTPWGQRIENEVFLNWDGGHIVEWSVLSGAGLSMMSEVSCGGIAGWPDGTNVLVSFTNSNGTKEIELISGVAPTSNSLNASDPAQWMRFADTLVGIMEGLVNSEEEFFEEEPDEDATDDGQSDEGAINYLRCIDGKLFDFDDMFRLYLTSPEANHASPGFWSWISSQLSEGTYKPA